MATNWQLSGDYFENCNCNVVCPCLISPAPPLTSRPTQGVCDVALAFHIDRGSYGAVALDGLNLALIAHTPGPMADGNWTAAVYVDDRASDQQAEALGAIFGGGEGGPMAAFAPLIATNLGVKKVPITYRVTGKARSTEIPGIMHMSVEPLPTLREDGEMWASSGHPIAPDKLALAVGSAGSTYTDHGMRPPLGPAGAARCSHPSPRPSPSKRGEGGWHHSPVFLMLAGVLAITGLRLLWLVLQPADLYPDEAQYWFWAQHLALGYYSKPPLVAWLIALTTGLFGESEFAIRLAAPLLHAGTAIFVYAIAARLYDRRVGLWSALAYASLPGASVSGFIISTDAPLVLFWATALYAFIRAREGGRTGWWVAVGLACGLGLLAKYAMAYWLFSALGYALLVPAERRHLRPLLAAAALALLVYSPNFWWNWQNGFVSYVHVRDNAGMSEPLIHPEAFPARCSLPACSYSRHRRAPSPSRAPAYSPPLRCRYWR